MNPIDPATAVAAPTASADPPITLNRNPAGSTPRFCAASSPRLNASRSRPVVSSMAIPIAISGAASQTCTKLRSVSEPISQNMISVEANGFGDKLSASEVNAPATLDTATPARISVVVDPLAPARATITIVASAAPVSPASGKANAMRPARPEWIAVTAPSAAPPEMPSRPGSASGLRR